MTRSTRKSKETDAKFEICILAGGLSSRMGRDKATIRIGKTTLLGIIKAMAKKTGWPVRVIRRDLVERCGPLGGVYTALKSTRAEAVLFLACDMPFVTAELLQKLISRFGTRTNALFIETEEGAGFPFILPTAELVQIEQQLSRKRFSLQALAEAMKARTLRPLKRERPTLLNINTAADWKRAEDSFREHAKKHSA